MWRKHPCVFQDKLKYIHNDIVKPLHLGILRYAERLQEIYDLANYLPPPSIRDESFEAARWDVRDK